MTASSAPEVRSADGDGNDRSVCPSCGVSLIGGPIPQEYIDAGFYGDPDGEHYTHWRRDIVVYGGDRATFLGYRCPDCGAMWGRPQMQG